MYINVKLTSSWRVRVEAGVSLIHKQQIMDFEKIKEYLSDLNYPNVNLMSNEQISAIFGQKNRTAFVKWAVNQIDNLNLPADEKKLKVVLADVLEESGLCLSSQKELFVSGSPSLSLLDQYYIIIRMLSYLKDIKINESLTKIEKMSVDEIKAFSDIDLNLFPEMGLIKSKTESERLDKMKGAEEEIDALKQEIAELQGELGQSPVTIFVSEEPDFESLQKDLIMFEDNLLQNGISRSKTNNKSVQEDLENEGKFSSEINGNLKICNEDLKVISKYMKNISDLSEISNKPVSVLDESENKFCNIIENAAEVSKELLKVLQEI